MKARALALRLKEMKDKEARSRTAEEEKKTRTDEGNETQSNSKLSRKLLSPASITRRYTRTLQVGGRLMKREPERL